VTGSNISSADQDEAVEKRPAVFLDRDGTINVEKDYLWRPEDFEFIAGSVEAIRRLKEAGFLVIVVTNQSGVARGYFGIEEVETLHRHIQEQLEQAGTRIDGFYLCPHHPEQGVGAFRRECDCRKGNPGLLLQAAREHGIDLAASFMVGDKRADLEAGRRAGCRSFLVLTGYGREEAQKLPSGSFDAFPSLQEAVDFILEQRTPQP
jgi:D-glycero-D-manno-heptose 1,7-bisphosphate phosphatase